jgi:hypothetical protein
MLVGRRNLVGRRLLRLTSVCLTLLAARGHYPTLALAGVLPLATAGRGFASTLALAGVSSQAFYLRSATGIAGRIYDRPRKQHCNRGRENGSRYSDLAHRPISFSSVIQVPDGLRSRGLSQNSGCAKSTIHPIPWVSKLRLPSSYSRFPPNRRVGSAGTYGATLKLDWKHSGFLGTFSASARFYL